MTVRVHKSDRCRHLVLRASAGELLPDAIAAQLGEEGVACGWLQGSGVLADVELRAGAAQQGQPGSVRRIAGPVQVLALESSIGLVDGKPALSLRAVLARETDRGLETLAGEIVRARTLALEALVTVFEDLALQRVLDPATGVSMLDPGPGPARPPVGSAVSVPLPRPAPGAAGTAGWSGALEASAQAQREPSAPARPTATTGAGAAMPQRPARRGPDQTDAPVPEAGDVVDHFAFGRCDVVKSDGERLHLRIHKDGRIREIALEMLRVTPLNVEADADGTGPRFKLERRI
jgi:predicted DNA-binding protein with PD1-like motif